jgi:hypothetical protein
METAYIILWINTETLKVEGLRNIPGALEIIEEAEDEVDK